MRQVQVFKWVQERDADGKLQNLRVADGTAMFLQFGSSYEEFENGPANYTTAIIERQDGSVQQVNADMIKFIAPTAATAHIGAKWEKVQIGGEAITRLRTPTGWLIREYAEVAHIGQDQHKYITTGYDWRIAMTFVPDPDGAWLADGGAA